MATHSPCPKCGRPFGAPTAACQACQAAGTLIDARYTVEYELGRGAFGVVYRAYDQDMGRPVAVKMLRETALDSDEAVRRFQEEARILSQVTHSNVLAVYGRGKHEGKYYIVFPFIKGKTLEDRIRATGAFEPAQAARLVARLAKALHYVHAEHNILHRDVKPANLMCQDGDEDSLSLMDFGLAVCHQTDRTRATQDGTLMGTPRYMSPEQAKGKVHETSHRSDLYSAAVILFELLTGRPPFLSPYPAIFVDIIQTQPQRPSSLRPGLDPQLEAIVLKGLAKDPAKRYQTGKEFAEALEQWASAPAVTTTTARGAFGSGARTATVTALPPLGPGQGTPGRASAAPAAPATGQGSSVLTSSTVNVPKTGARVVVKKLPPVSPPALPPAAPQKSATSSAVRPPAPLPLPPSDPPSRPAPRPLRPRPPSNLKFHVLLTLIALGVLLVGIAALVLAIKPKTMPSTPATEPKKVVNPFRDGVQDKAKSANP